MGLQSVGGIGEGQNGALEGRVCQWRERGGGVGEHVRVMEERVRQERSECGLREEDGDLQTLLCKETSNNFN